MGIVYTQLDTSTPTNGSQWAKAQTISKRDGYSNQNAVLYADQKSKLHVFHSQQGAGAGESHATLWHLASEYGADGRTSTFSKPVLVFAQPGSFNKNRVLERLDGSWLVPIYGQDKKPNYPKNELLPAGADPD